MSGKVIEAAQDAAIAPPAGAKIFSDAERMRVILGILTCILLSAVDQTVVLPAIPQIAGNLQGVGHLSWVVSAYLLTNTATTPIYGKLSDQLGRRNVLVPALVFFIFASVLCALAQSISQLIIARALQGVGGGALMAVAQAAVADVVPPRERGKYQGWFASAWAFASIAGPVVGGFVAEHLSWRWIFWLNVPIGALALVLCIRGLAGLAPAGLRGRIDYAGAVLTLIAVGAILAALSTSGVDFAWGSWQEAAIWLLGLAGFAALFVQQRGAGQPLFPRLLLAQASFRNVLEIAFLNSAALFGGIFLFPLMLQWRFHQSPSASGVEIVPFLFTTTVGAFFAGRLMRHTGRSRPIMAAGVAMAALAFFLLTLLPAWAPLACPILVSSLFGLGIGAVMPTTLVAAQNAAAGRDIGAATGTLLLLRAMGGAFGATIAGAMLVIAGTDAPRAFVLGFLSCALMLAIALMVAWRMEDVQLRGNSEPAPTVKA